MLDAPESARCETDPKARLHVAKSIASDIKPPKRKEPRYTPLSKRQDRPDAIAWLLRNHPELSDQQICKLLGTTKATVQAVRDRTHWKSSGDPSARPGPVGTVSATGTRRSDHAREIERESRQPNGSWLSAADLTVLGVLVARPVAGGEQAAVAFDQGGDVAQRPRGAARERARPHEHAQHAPVE